MELFRAGFAAPDPAYNNIRDGESHWDISGRDLCNKLWKVFEPLADKHFMGQFAIDFDARFWEMDLTCAFIEKSFNVNCPKPGPDICIDFDGWKLWVEAIAPGDGGGADQVPGYSMGTGIAQPVPDGKIILRLTSAIVEKHDKYLSYLEKGIISDSEPYIIAINGSQIKSSRSDFNPPRVVRAVFPIGNEYLTFDKVSGNVVDSGFEYKASVRKENGTEIPIDIFLNPKFEGVSAVLFSNSDCCNRPEITGMDYVLIHNPLAKNKISEGLIKFGCEYIAEVKNGTEYELRCNKY